MSNLYTIDLIPDRRNTLHLLGIGHFGSVRVMPNEDPDYKWKVMIGTHDCGWHRSRNEARRHARELCKWLGLER